MSLFGDLPGPDDGEFDGDTYEPELDRQRLAGQLGAVHSATMDRGWLTLAQIGRDTGIEPRSVSARLRDLRKERFGAFVVERRPAPDAVRGVFEYRVTGKGQGTPKRRGESTPDQESALRLADALLPFLKHHRQCMAVTTLVQDGLGQCTCGLHAMREAYREVRRRTR